MEMYETDTLTPFRFREVAGKLLITKPIDFVT
jgi:hypothetical protein